MSSKSLSYCSLRIKFNMSFTQMGVNGRFWVMVSICLEVQNKQKLIEGQWLYIWHPTHLLARQMMCSLRFVQNQMLINHGLWKQKAAFSFLSLVFLIGWHRCIWNFIFFFSSVSEISLKYLQWSGSFFFLSE